MEEYKKVLWTGIILIGIIGIGFGVYYFFFSEKSEEPPFIEEVKEEPSEAQMEKPASEEVKRVPRLEGLNLNKSDDLVRKLATELSSHPQISVWLKNEDLVRKFAAIVDNLVNDLSPRSLVEFLAPKGEFKVIKKGGSFFVDPASYNRYDLLTEVFVSLDTQECAKLYWDLKPLFQEAYLELGYPTQHFHDNLTDAMVELLKTPVVDGDLMLEKKVVTYKMVDPKLEQLTLPQKHLLRMGPRNVRKIQAKLRELALAIGFPESELPQPVVYSPLKRR